MSSRDMASIQLKELADEGAILYIIINLLERVIEVYRQPSASKGRLPKYGEPRRLIVGDVLEIPAARGRHVSVPVEKLLP